MYVGSGDKNSSGQRARMYIISLIDGKILYQRGHSEDLALRSWCAFDSAPLVDANTDTLIWPGENGLLYTMDLNTDYDKEAGTISVDPSNVVIARYRTSRSSSSTYWYGYEPSASIVDHYLYISENGGMFFCIDLNTMELVWAQDTKDDSNSTPAFEMMEDGTGYVYTAPSLHWTKNSNNQGTISIYKLNALTGEIVWEVPYHVHTIPDVSGGVQSSPLLGKPGTALDGMILYTISRTRSTYSGTLVALDTETGEEVWRWEMKNYAWSSPATFYDDEGNAFVVVCDSGGYATVLDGATGEVLYQMGLGGLVEASPAIYENMLVVGTRTGKIRGVKIK
jgi:outer membrane protein assembly factor BamB